MSGSVMITVGYPHELLGHLRRLEGAGDINFFADSGRLLDEYRKKYSGYGQGVKELETAARLGIITEMVEIYSEPMWRKRAFINKSAIRLMQQPGIKEYEMVELLEGGKPRRKTVQSGIKTIAAEKHRGLIKALML